MVSHDGPRLASCSSRQDYQDLLFPTDRHRHPPLLPHLLSWAGLSTGERLSRRESGFALGAHASLSAVQYYSCRSLAAEPCAGGARNPRPRCPLSPRNPGSPNPHRGRTPSSRRCGHSGKPANSPVTTCQANGTGGLRSPHRSAHPPPSPPALTNNTKERGTGADAKRFHPQRSKSQNEATFAPNPCHHRLRILLSLPRQTPSIPITSITP